MQVRQKIWTGISCTQEIAWLKQESGHKKFNINVFEIKVLDVVDCLCDNSELCYLHITELYVKKLCWNCCVGYSESVVSSAKEIGTVKDKQPCTKENL